MAFLPTNPPLARALTERNYNDPTPVQTAVLEPDAEGRDLLVSAQTGSGKTVAYGLALGSTLLGEAERLDAPEEPLALIVAPTRELALQVHRELQWLYAFANARVVACVGGMDPRSEARQLAQGAHIVVGTPGRLRDHLERGRLKIAGLKAVVLDEADEMLDLGFREDLEFILDATPKERRTLLFSATLPKEIVTLARQYQRDALRIQAAGGERGHADITYRAIRVAANEVEHTVVNVLRFAEAPTAIVFCNTREAVRHLQAILLERGFSVVALSGELSQGERNHALQALRDGRARVCVATDVAARGIDLPSLGLVIHADLPHDAEVLQHRSGRTGRAGRKGISVLLVPQSKRRKAEQLLNTARIRAEWVAPPSVEDIKRLDQERLLESPVFTEEVGEDDLAMAKALLAARSAEEIAVALARLYRAQLPAPEEVLDAGPQREVHEDRAPKGRRERGPGKEREPRVAAPRRKPGVSGLSGGVWFRLNVGRQKNADPRWLLPMICRQGGVTRREIGTIDIYDQETRFEVDGAAAEAFEASIRNVPKGEARIERVRGDAPAPATAAAHVEPADRPRREPKGQAPREERPRRETVTEQASERPRHEPKEWKPKADRPAGAKGGKSFKKAHGAANGGKPHGKPHSPKGKGKPVWASKKGAKGGKPGAAGGFDKLKHKGPKRG
ncbi:DEAD/DEAH box helicase [Parvibaculum sp.]|uniref:DEAD/DEAH box helicase n=1 Tax=Parvibaculum sp. TaxID=2024848 RepID=UPI002CE30574|nr:DEAD/DEAH box helicase [Parvibaculum sp.]HUD51100.1 DEAD/DEAH box helicase [Parvibaculum sp.]